MGAVEAHARMATVGMVVPVVVISNVKTVGRAFGKAEQIRLAVIPEMVVAEGHVGGLFAVQGTIALDLVLVATRMAVEEVAVVHPNVLVILLQANVVAFVGIDIHNTDVADFNIESVLDTNAPAVCRSVVTDTFDRHGATFLFAHVNQDVTLVGHFGVGHVANQANGERTRIVALLERRQDILEAHAFRYSTLAARHHIKLDGILGRFGHIENHGAALERTIGLVSTRNMAVAKSEARAIMGLNGQGLRSGGSTFFAALDRGHLERVATGLEADHVNTVLGAVLANKLAVYLDVACASARIVNIVAVRTIGSPFGKSRFEPAFGRAERHLGISPGKSEQRNTKRHPRNHFGTC